MILLFFVFFIIEVFKNCEVKIKVGYVKQILNSVNKIVMHFDDLLYKKFK